MHIAGYPPLKVDMLGESGTGGYPCPHDLLLSSVGSCFLGTFLVFQRQFGLEMEDLKIYVRESMELATEGPDRGKYDITSMELYVYARVKGDEDDKLIVGDCIRLTEQHCPITRALRKAFPVKTISDIIMVAG